MDPLYRIGENDIGSHTVILNKDSVARNYEVILIIFEPRCLIESIFTDISGIFRNRDICKTPALIKGIVRNDTQALGLGDAGQLIALIENI